MSKRRSYKTGGGFRDGRVFVIATEGAKREVQYFQELAKNQRRVRVQLVYPDERNESAPKHTLSRVQAFVKEAGLGKDDQVWLVIDTDRWSDKQLMEVDRACRAKGWGLTISNPCFELWLYLHYSDLPPNYHGSAKDLKRDLGSLIPGGYNPREAVKLIDEAVRRAALLDTNPHQRLPPVNVTRVYALARAIGEFLE